MVLIGQSIESNVGVSSPLRDLDIGQDTRVGDCIINSSECIDSSSISNCVHLERIRARCSILFPLDSAVTLLLSDTII